MSNNDKLKKHPNAVFLPTGAFKIDKNGNPIGVEFIIAPSGSGCCMLDCCDKTIKWISDVDKKPRSIKLDDLYDLINP